MLTQYVSNPHRQGLIKDLEKVQKRATKLVLTVKHLTYKERLQPAAEITNFEIQTYKRWYDWTF